MIADYHSDRENSNERKTERLDQDVDEVVMLMLDPVDLIVNSADTAHQKDKDKEQIVQRYLLLFFFHPIQLLYLPLKFAENNCRSGEYECSKNIFQNIAKLLRPMPFYE